MENSTSPTPQEARLALRQMAVLRTAALAGVKIYHELNPFGAEESDDLDLSTSVSSVQLPSSSLPSEGRLDPTLSLYRVAGRFSVRRSTLSSLGSGSIRAPSPTPSPSPSSTHELAR
jgi:hypothetical protein